MKKIQGGGAILSFFLSEEWAMEVAHLIVEASKLEEGGYEHFGSYGGGVNFSVHTEGRACKCF